MDYISTDNINIKLDRIVYRSRVQTRYQTSGRESNGFIYYLKGGHLFDFGDHIVETKKGDFVYMPFGSAYKNKLLADDTEYFQVDFSLFQQGRACSLFEDIRIISAEKASDYFLLIKEIYDLYSMYNSSYNISCIGNICKLINMIMLANERAELKIKGSNTIAESVKYIEEHYNEDTSIFELAKISNISISNLEKTFKKCYKTTPIAYRNSIRIDEAKKLILTGYSISEASEMVGFPNYYYFCKMFKKQLGVSPGEYRSLNKGT